MSKNFEDEYRQLMTEDTPDLWDRIEAGLKDKTVTASTESKRMRQISDIESHRVNRKAMRNTLAAAAIVVVILIGGAAIRGRSKFETNSASTTASDVAPQAEEWDGAMDSAVPEEAYSEEAYSEEAYLETEEVSDAYEQAESAREENGSQNASQEVNYGYENPAESAEYDSADEYKSAAGSEMTEEMQQLSYHLTMQITEIENTGEEILYYATVLHADEDAIEVGGTVCFYTEADASEDLPEYGCVYEAVIADMSPELSSYHPYLLLEMIKISEAEE